MALDVVVVVVVVVVVAGMGPVPQINFTPKKLATIRAFHNPTTKTGS